ncbi:MAG: hypothetical protein P1U57_01980 [Oleibacter sp.]|nr:hypothetical protein [Thalassolituus sp.]
MKSKLTLISLAISCATLVACGGGSGGSSKTPTTSLSGKAADGYLINAIACLDLNNNAICDAGEPSSRTDNNGSFSFEASASDFAAYSVIVRAVANETIDSDNPSTAITKSFSLAAPAGSTFVSPLTTLIYNIKRDNPALSDDAVAESIKTKFGLDIDPTSDYIANGNTNAHEVAQKITKVVANSEEKARADAGAGLTDDKFGAVLSAIMDDVFEQSDSIIAAQSDEELPVLDVVPEGGIDELVAEQESEASGSIVSTFDVLSSGIYDLYFYDDRIDGITHVFPERYPVKLVDGIFGDSLNEFFDNNVWNIETDEDGDFDVILTSDGWVTDNGDCSLIAEGLNARETCAGDSVLITAAEVSLSGRQVKDELQTILDQSRSDLDDDIADKVETLISSISTTFSEGAKGYSFAFTERTDYAELNCYTTVENDLGRCDTVGGADTLEELFSLNTSFYVNTNGDFFDAELDGAFSDNTGDVIKSGTETVEVVGTWNKIIMKGKTLIVLDIMNNDDDFQDMFTAVEGKGVVSGNYRKGKDGGTDVLNYNDAAMNNITTGLTNKFPFIDRVE